MNNDLVWTRTVLTSYRYLERISGAIDKIVLQSGLNGGNVYGRNYLYNNVYSLSQRIINLSQRKITLINLKILVESTWEEMNKEQANLLIERYVDCVKRKDLAVLHDVSLRTIFRKIENAEIAFCKRLCTKGYSSEKLSAFLKEEKWIQNIFKTISSRGEEDVCLSKFQVLKAGSM